MNIYIKNHSGLVTNKKCILSLINSKNKYSSYNQYLNPEFISGSPTFTETINFSLGKNLKTKPYFRII